VYCQPFFWFERRALGILPAILLARLMPERIQFCLNIVFPGVGKIALGSICRTAELTGQNLPLLGRFCRSGGKYFHIF